MKFKIATIIATFFGVGNIKYAPGTFGSLASFPLFFIFAFLIEKNGLSGTTANIVIFFIDIIVLYIMGWWAINVYITANKKDDPKEIVIDEVVGQLIAYMLPLIFPYRNVPTNPNLFNILWFILPFILFRFFDIKKPSLVGYFDKNWHNANGILLDDVVAGIYAAICVIIILCFI
ncbi:MAG: phosphatidylglycerophosphatase A [Rickettsiales bacterium]|jgi:phosphatidylglycerophosphatase A|nr:phosphatidylglycerophosphatase A [Rickettsiales bacterium]